MKWIVCVNNEGYPASLQARKLYSAVEDETAENLGLLRVIDESGEDYLHPKERFVQVDIAEPLEQQLLAA